MSKIIDLKDWIGAFQVTPNDAQLSFGYKQDGSDAQPIAILGPLNARYLPRYLFADRPIELKHRREHSD